MKELSLEETWTECLRMWKWIVKRKKAGDPRTVGILKIDWIRKSRHGVIYASCFFCQFSSPYSCKECPGKNVSRAFSCCHRDYHYEIHPTKFYKKLVELNKKRKQDKENKK